MSTEKSALHIAALEYVARGRRVIPIAPGAKTPLIKKWHENAFTTAEQVDAHWTEYPDSNIAFCPEDEGIAIIEQDPGGDVTPLNLPPTYEVQSPRGGIHYYFAGTCPPTVQKLGPHIDTRGISSYVLIPPSVVKGKVYSVKQDRAIAALPAEIETQLASRADARQSDVHERDVPGNYERGRDFIRLRARGGAAAIQGGGGDNLTYEISCHLIRDLGLSVSRALELMEQEWAPHCQPWDRDWALSKLKNAARYGQNEPGAYASAPASVVFASASLAKAESEQRVPGQPRGRFLFKTADQMTDSPDPQWIVPELVPANSIILLTGPKGNFKSFLALDLGLGIATGRSTFGMTPLLTGPVFYGAWEGLQLLEKTHRGAWLKDHGLDPRDPTVPFHIAAGPSVAINEEVQQFGEAIQDRLDWSHPGQNPRLIILDTYSKCMMGLDENDPGAANGFVKVCYDYIRAWPGCSVAVLAHTGKDTTKGTRGSSALEAGFDTVVDINRIDRSNVVKATVRHMRAGPERVSPFTMKGRAAHDSLVFEYMKPDEAQAVSALMDPLHQQRVANVLRQIDAVGEGAAVTTPVIALHLTSQVEGEREEAYQARVRMTEKNLKLLGRPGRPLARLTIQGHVLKWYVPPLEDIEEQADPKASEQEA